MKKFYTVFSNEIVKKYWTPRPFIKPHLDTKALNKETEEILSEKIEEEISNDNS